MLLNLADDVAFTRALGPGLRLALWVQGCRFHCPGCLAPAWREKKRALACRPEALAHSLARLRDARGITISGGEPFLQAPALCRLVEALLAVRPEWDVIVFSGHYLRDLSWPSARRLLAHTDLLIAGPYQAELNDERGLRGSNNQRLHFLSPKLRPWAGQLLHGPRRQEVWVEAGAVRRVGMPGPDRLRLSPSSPGA